MERQLHPYFPRLQAANQKRGVTMVTTQTPGANVVSGPDTGRGFIMETAVAKYGFPMFSAGYPHFWGSVVAGTLVTMSLGVLSEALMFGCHVGVNSEGAVELHGGAAVWLIVTACVAYFIGGAIAGSIGYRSDPHAWLRGVTLWGLSIPLAMFMATAVAGGAGVMYAHMAPITAQMANSAVNPAIDQGVMYINFSEAWISFLAMLGALIFAVLGSMPRRRGGYSMLSGESAPINSAA
jgi:hypothetical protein